MTIHDGETCGGHLVRTGAGPFDVACEHTDSGAPNARPTPDPPKPAEAQVPPMPADRGAATKPSAGPPWSAVYYNGNCGHYVSELSWQATVWYDGTEWHVKESSW